MSNKEEKVTLITKNFGPLYFGHYISDEKMFKFRIFGQNFRTKLIATPFKKDTKILSFLCILWDFHQFFELIVLNAVLSVLLNI